MKNRIIAIFILITSFILLIKSLSSLKIYNYVKTGNSLVEKNEYEEARKNYEKALKLKENPEIRKNIMKSFYLEKKYDKVLESDIEDGFLKGNSYVFIEDNNSQQKNIENYQKALEEYKLAMKSSQDINIKKNYELTLKKIEDLQQQQNSQNNSKDKNNSENKEQNKSDKNQNNNSNKEKQDNNSNNKEQNQENKNNQNSEKENQTEANNQKQQSSNQNSSSNKEEVKEQELKAILKRLEGNEKQAFKNNERVLNTTNDDSNNRW